MFREAQRYEYLELHLAANYQQPYVTVSRKRMRFFVQNLEFESQKKKKRIASSALYNAMQAILQCRTPIGS